MIRITRQTDYGIVLLTHFAQSPPGETHNARDLAEETHLPLPMVSKILKILAREGILSSQRGARGGYGLSRSPHDIGIAEVISALEGPIAITECSVDGPGCCEKESWCPVCANWNRINQAIREALEGITLAEMAQPRGIPPASRNAGRRGSNNPRLAVDMTTSATRDETTN